MENESSIVLSNKKLHDCLYEMVLRAPKIAASAKPAQFVHVELPDLQANILRRPFSILDTDKESGTVSLLYQVVGVGTDHMTKWQPGYLTTMIGPIGNTWSATVGAKRALLVGGGVGAAPLFMLYKKLVQSNVHVDVVLGASSKDMLVCHDKYRDVVGILPHCATDDGTFGAHGFATVCVESLLGKIASGECKPYDYAAVCGPVPMMKAVSSITVAAGVPTQVSLEKRMACGIGACLSCVCETNDGLKRSCVDGPVFDALDLGW